MMLGVESGSGQQFRQIPTKGRSGDIGKSSGNGTRSAFNGRSSMPSGCTHGSKSARKAPVTGDAGEPAETSSAGSFVESRRGPRHVLRTSQVCRPPTRKLRRRNKMTDTENREKTADGGLRTTDLVRRLGPAGSRRPGRQVKCNGGLCRAIEGPKEYLMECPCCGRRWKRNSTGILPKHRARILPNGGSAL